VYFVCYSVIEHAYISVSEVGSVKSAISKIAADHPKQWHTHLACVLWALRESRNSTTGVPPWLLAFGRLPRGSLSVLKDTWTGAEDPPLSLGKSVIEYLQDLRKRFATADHRMLMLSRLSTQHAITYVAEKNSSKLANKF